MRLVIIDNYDSFTFNLKHACGYYVEHIDVFRNDALKITDLYKYDKIIISPGPGLPEDAGLSLDIISHFSCKKPILGICLGAQAIAVSFGFQLFNLNKVIHGKRSKIKILDSEDKIYSNLPKEFFVGRYHSWAINMNSNNDFVVTSVDESNIVMSFRHKKFAITGLQYHPESILTDHGKYILKKWLLD